jgi:hypothetical protein
MLKSIRIFLASVGLASALFLGLAETRGANAASDFPARHRTYSTRFNLAEDPISEGGKWINGATAGLDWANVRTTPGLAFGTEPGTVKYDDSTALLSGPWGPNQTAQATVRSVNQKTNVYEEVELRLRSTLSPHQATGYEIDFRCSKTEKAYSEIVRWNGPLGSFTYLKRGAGSRYGVKDGDVVKATIVGSTITVYVNGVQTLQATDPTYTAGSPGMGFYIQEATSGHDDYGFTSFEASDFFASQRD